MILLLVILIILLILFFPIKVKFTVIYKDAFLYVYFFNKSLNIKEKIAREETNARNAKLLDRFMKNILPDDYRTVYRKLTKNPFKPSLDLKYELDYGFEDAALTGMFYGIFGGLNGVIYRMFSSTVRIKGYEYNVLPHYNNPMFNFRIISIFSFNLAKIIYMLILIYILKEVESE